MDGWKTDRQTLFYRTLWAKARSPINTKTKVAVGVYLSKKKIIKKTGYIIPTMNCYPRNG